MSSLQNELTRLIGVVENLSDTERAKVDAQVSRITAMESNLRGVVAEEMYFSANWKPSQTDPVDTSGTRPSYKSLQTLINAAPQGSHVLVYMTNDEIYVLDELIGVTGKRLWLYGANGTAYEDRPVLTCPTVDGENFCGFVGQIDLLYGGSVRFERINIALEPKGDKPWSNQRSIVRVEANRSGHGDVSATYIRVSGSDGAGLVRNHTAAITTFSCYLAEFHGDIFVNADANNGISLIAGYGLVFDFGAEAQSGGVVGQNVLLDVY